MHMRKLTHNTHSHPHTTPCARSIESRMRTCPAECVSTVQFAVQPSLDRSSTASARHLRASCDGECRQGAPPPLFKLCGSMRALLFAHKTTHIHGCAHITQELHRAMRNCTNRPASGNGHSCSVRGLTAVSTADLLAPYMSTVHHFSVCPRLYFTCTAWKTHGSTACKNCVPQSAPPSQRATQLEVWVLCRWKFH